MSHGDWVYYPDTGSGAVDDKRFFLIGDTSVDEVVSAAERSRVYRIVGYPARLVTSGAVSDAQARVANRRNQNGVKTYQVFYLNGTPPHAATP